MYAVARGGTCVRQKVSVAGSGSGFIYGFVDANYKEKMSREECMEFIKTSKLDLFRHFVKCSHVLLTNTQITVTTTRISLMYFEINGYIDWIVCFL